jgi:hypothetical protein
MVTALDPRSVQAGRAQAILQQAAGPRPVHVRLRAAGLRGLPRRRLPRPGASVLLVPAPLAGGYMPTGQLRLVQPALPLRWGVAQAAAAAAAAAATTSAATGTSLCRTIGSLADAKISV